MKKRDPWKDRNVFLEEWETEGGQDGDGETGRRDRHETRWSAFELAMLSLAAARQLRW